MFQKNYEENDVREAAKIVSGLLKALEFAAKPGINILALEEFAKNYIEYHGATPYNKGYHPIWASVPFPSILCVNVNDEAVHSPAKNYVLEDGDIVNFDVGLRYKTGCGDAASTLVLGNATKEKTKLVAITKMALNNAIRLIKPGINTNTIALEIDRTVKQYGYRSVRGYGGHRIGEEMHLPPFIPHEKNIAFNRLEAGMIVCIEPVITNGNGILRKEDDGWTEKTIDGSNVAQFEDMVLITPTGHEVLTTHLS